MEKANSTHWKNPDCFFNREIMQNHIFFQFIHSDHNTQNLRDPVMQ